MPLQILSIRRKQLVLVVCFHHTVIEKEINGLIFFLPGLFQGYVHRDFILTRSKIKKMAVEGLYLSLLIFHFYRNMVKNPVILFRNPRHNA